VVGQVARISELVAPRLRPGVRTIVGIAGPPGAGKSTLAAAVVADYGPDWGPGVSTGRAVVVPMDGFHLSNVELERLGLADRKGAPATFDADGFVHLLRRIRARDADLVYAPAYSRKLRESVGGAIPVGRDVELVVVEGNYLLLPEPPWAPVRELLDLAVFLDAPARVRLPGLLRRQRARGLDAAGAEDWVHRSDEANARLVAATRQYADAVLVRTERD
jgi:pantothenate kinase